MLNPTAISSFLGDPTITNSVLEEIQQMAIGYINSYLCYNIQETEYIYETNDNLQYIYTPQYPITTITSIEENEGDIFDETLVTVDPVDYRIMGNAGKILLKNCYQNPLKVTYKAGYI